MTLPEVRVHSGRQPTGLTLLPALRFGVAQTPPLWRGAASPASPEVKAKHPQPGRATMRWIGDRGAAI